MHLLAMCFDIILPVADIIHLSLASCLQLSTTISGIVNESSTLQHNPLTKDHIL